MSEVFYIVGTNDLNETWKKVDGPFKEYLNLNSWCPEEYPYQFYKCIKVWEFPF